ncbi:DDE-1 domain-containing protein [Plasmodiophora brassicae]|uniref:Uncharacterized protein n=1 Tax=Plasmodiophora brassicae TaxID=37360 RepID=A0A0G4J750_PLABS|nr:hypothetical protein PBRA_002929 [Plasmodiophora brassicae]
MLGEASTTFYGAENMVHVDEKYFYITKNRRKFYIVPDAIVPERYFITKVMLPNRATIMQANVTFIGLWPIVKKEPAQRASRNRPRGTLITRSYEMNREAHIRIIVENVIPAVKESGRSLRQHSGSSSKQDNTRSHAKISVMPTSTQQPSCLSTDAELVRDLAHATLRELPPDRAL